MGIANTISMSGGRELMDRRAWRSVHRRCVFGLLGLDGSPLPGACERIGEKLAP